MIAPQAGRDCHPAGMEESRGLFDKAKAAMGQAAGKAKEEVEDLQTRLDLGRAQRELGKAAYELIESGELAHPALEAPAARIRELSARSDGEPPDAVDEEPDTPEA
jgi:hypothetical protein